MNNSSGAPSTPARMISATAALRIPSSFSARMPACDPSAERSLTISGCASSTPTSASSPALSLTSFRRRVADEELYRLQHDLFENRWDFSQRMFGVEAVVGTFDQTKRAHSRRQGVQPLGLRARDSLVRRSVHD